MTFKRMGASMQIRRQYSAVLTLSVTIQLALFFIVASAGLWLDQLINGAPSQFAKGRMAYEVVTAFVLVVSLTQINNALDLIAISVVGSVARIGTQFPSLLDLPMLTHVLQGWISVRKERRILMALFLIMSILYVASWGAMFASISFRWTFMQWRFFKLMTSASVVLTTATLITGIVCRVGFGKGLPEHRMRFPFLSPLATLILILFKCAKPVKQRTRMHSARLTFGMTSQRSRPRKWSSLLRGTLSLHSPPPSGLTAREPHRKNHSSRTHRWALVSSRDLRFHSTNRLSLNHPPSMLVNSPRLRLLPPTCINTTGVSATTPVPIRMPPL